MVSSLCSGQWGAVAFCYDGRRCQSRGPIWFAGEGLLPRQQPAHRIPVVHRRPIPQRVGSRRALLGADHRGRAWEPSQRSHRQRLVRLRPQLQPVLLRPCLHSDANDARAGSACACSPGTSSPGRAARARGKWPEGYSACAESRLRVVLAPYVRGGAQKPIEVLGLAGTAINSRMASKSDLMAWSWPSRRRSSSPSFWARASLDASIRRRPTKARMMATFTCMARSLRSTLESMATPCSVKA